MLSTAHLRKALITVFAANIITWYEVSLFALFSAILGTRFFPQESPLVVLIHSFLIYSIGFISRPLGTLFFSHIGDMVGRRAALIISIIMMTIPTFGVALTPSYFTIGLAAPLFVFLMGLVQGFATGGEVAGTMCYLYEISPVRSRGFAGSLTFCASQLGTIVAIIEFLLLQEHVTADFLAAWGWRITFILGGFLGLIGWFLRSTLHETPLFEMIKTEKKLSKRPIFESFSEHKMGMFKAFGLSALSLAGWYIIFIFSPVYFSQELGMDHQQLLLINLLLLLISTLTMPFFGLLFDRDYRKSLFFISAIATFLISIPFFYLAAHNYLSMTLFVLLEIVISTLITVQFALLPVLLAELFPLRLRYTCVGVSYNFCNLIFGGLAPILLLVLSEKTAFILGPALLLMATAVLSSWAFIKTENALPKPS